MQDHLSHVAAADAWNSAVSSGASLAFTSQTCKDLVPRKLSAWHYFMQSSSQHDLMLVSSGVTLCVPSL